MWQRTEQENSTEELGDGVSARYAWYIDDDSDVSWLGVLTDDESETTVKRESVGWHEYKYIESGQSFAERFAFYQDYLAKQGVTRPITEAAKRAKRELDEDCAMLERYASGAIWDESCEASLCIFGVEVASASLHGISQPDDSYRREIERELLVEARSDATEALKTAVTDAVKRAVAWDALLKAQKHPKKISAEISEKK